MDYVKRKDIPDFMMLGRKTNVIMGLNGIIRADDAMAAYATFSPKYGRMESHCHDNEYMYVINAKDAIVKYGNSKDTMTNIETLQAGDIIRPVKGEWHRFDFLSDDGFVDFLNFFATTTPHVINESDVDLADMWSSGKID